MELSPLITLEPHNQAWCESFEALRIELIENLGEIAESIEHFGSTSIEGIVAKPIIDVIGQVKSLQDLDQELPKLPPNRFKNLGENGVQDRRYLVVLDSCGKVVAHVHLFPLNHSGYADRILFRDYLRNHQEASRQYEQLKIALSIKFQNDPTSYWKGKDEFVKKILSLAVNI
jgi:GrpB-like predicted nucleotidyltransferase (UPF0157 family)